MNPSASAIRPSSSENQNETNTPSNGSAALLTRRRFLPLDPPTPISMATNNSPNIRIQSEPTSSQASTNNPEPRRRDREAQRNLMEVHRDTLRAAERTISLLREQIRLHDERARLSIASLVPSPAPIGTPARTPTQRAALERSLSSRIASLQADIERQQLRAGAVGLIRRPETEALLEERNMLSTRRAAPRIPPRAIPNACPIVPFSATSIPTPNRIYSSRSSSDRWLAGRQRDNILSSSSSARPCSAELFREHHLFQRPSSESSSSSAHEALEREWERQLADGEVDSDGVPILPDPLKQMPIEYPQTSRTASHSFPGTATTYLGRRKVDGLGLQLAHLASSSPANHTHHLHPQTSNQLTFQPLCLR
ncbi:hypothetical protein PGT21_004554 [Puccinia graminis f. sp. tritici]|uniref:Uncharacterized protein n=1 Tax=Puccinia graminis f. sp. tritici TaxID=56615 RepID=A0A5B0QSU6_PUCGR|nr:hypothetical protein PGT21_004554 [Puccinia graminis f. sp. tritici]